MPLNEETKHQEFKCETLIPFSTMIKVLPQMPPNGCPVGCDCRIHRLLLCRGVRPSPNKCPEYDTKQSDGEVPAMLELWGNAEYPFIAIAPRSTLSRSGST